MQLCLLLLLLGAGIALLAVHLEDRPPVASSSHRVAEVIETGVSAPPPPEESNRQTVGQLPAKQNLAVRKSRSAAPAPPEADREMAPKVAAAAPPISKRARVEKSRDSGSKAAPELVRLHSEVSIDPAEDYRRAVALQKQGEWQQAREAYQRVLERYPASAEVYNNLGVIFEKQQQLEKAAECFEKAIDIDPRHCQSFNNLGIVYYRLQDYEKAVGAYKQALRLNPDNSQTRINLSLLYERLGRPELARGMLEELLALEPGSAEARYNLGRLLDRQGEFGAALKHYRYFLALEPAKYSRLQEAVRTRVEQLRSSSGS